MAEEDEEGAEKANNRVRGESATGFGQQITGKRPGKGLEK